MVRHRVLTAAIGGLLSAGAIVGVAAPGAQAATAAVPATTTPLAQAPTAEVAAAATPVVQVPERVARPSVPSYLPTVAHTRLVEAIALGRARRAVGARGVWRHMCLGFVRTRFGLPIRQHSAIGAWSVSSHKHRWDAHPPAGVPVFWSGGSRGHGHVALSLGHGMIVSTDLPYNGHVTRTTLSAPRRHWGLHYLGWTEDLEGYRIYRR
ncbi:MAG TPA: hypothetical protein VHU88_13480 [Sporichthyaceae bacterium]|nr:hypothetical protein [Sporichthyaceae bacterium]